MFSVWPSVKMIFRERVPVVASLRAGLLLMLMHRAVLLKVISISEILEMGMLMVCLAEDSFIMPCLTVEKPRKANIPAMLSVGLTFLTQVAMLTVCICRMKMKKVSWQMLMKTTQNPILISLMSATMRQQVCAVAERQK